VGSTENWKGEEKKKESMQEFPHIVKQNQLPTTRANTAQNSGTFYAYSMLVGLFINLFEPQFPVL
jgi:hypothetical protein